MPTSFKHRLSRGDLLVGTIISLPSPEVAEIFRWAGFDWLFVDLEHGAMGIGDAQALLQAAGGQLPCALRVPANDEVWIKRALDIGAAGIIAPNVRSAQAARQVVRLCKYPPEGVRSVGIARAQGYGQSFEDYVASANAEIAVVIQIEHMEAVGCIDEIVTVAGIDALFVGPYDLSASMGKMGQTGDAEVQAAISQVKHHADRAGLPVGVFGPTVESVQPYRDSGFTLLAIGIDTLMFGHAATKIVKAFQKGRN